MNMKAAKEKPDVYLQDWAEPLMACPIYQAWTTKVHAEADGGTRKKKSIMFPRIGKIDHLGAQHQEVCDSEGLNISVSL